MEASLMVVVQAVSNRLTAINGSMFLINVWMTPNDLKLGHYHRRQAQQGMDDIRISWLR
jgi:hypothetical protein